MHERDPNDDRLDSACPKDPTQAVDLPATPSFSFDNANCVLDIEIQADQLLAYIDKLTSIADRACASAIRQTETAQLLERSHAGELNRLRDQLDRQKNRHQEQQLALTRLEHESKAQAAAFENRLHEIERQRQNSELEAELLRLKEENAALASRLAAAASARKPAECEPKPARETIRLTSAASEHEEISESRTLLLQKTEAESRAKITALEQRLTTVEAELNARESMLKEKDSLIQRAAIKELELGNLIKRLSAECGTLSAALEEKEQAQPQAAADESNGAADSKIWQRVFRRLQHANS